MNLRDMAIHLLLAGWMTLTSWAAELPAFTISDLTIEGEIVEENVSFTMRFVAHVSKRGAEIPLVEGDVAFLGDTFPARSELRRDGQLLVLRLDRSGRQEVSFRFASLPRRDDDWRQTGFRIPQATVRKLVMRFDRPDLKVDFPGALRVSRASPSQDQTMVTAFLGATDTFTVRWKPQVRALDADLVVACAASTIASASVGALHIDHVFRYEVVQGGLKHLELALPPDINVTQVSGDDILEWRIDEQNGGPERLVVDLNQVHEQDYLLRVECDRVLPPFPMEADLPVITPEGVIRNSGFLAIGTDSAVKLLVRNATGLTQIDRSAFWTVPSDQGAVRTLPGRSVFVYQYANLPYRLRLSAEDIVTAFSCEEQLVLSLSDRDAALDAIVELDVRDAPAREVVVETDPDWTVANVSGANVADYTVDTREGKRLITVFFREAVLGRGLFAVRLERALPSGDRTLAVPAFRLANAGAERGFVVLTAEKGTRLMPEVEEGLRAVQTGSLPIRLPDAQRAFRYKTGAWQLALRIEDTTPSVHTELFHLVSLGEGALYGSCSITYSIDGAPVRELTLTIPETYGHVELVGRDIRNWIQDGETWTVVMQEKLLGDYTLLVTYDQPYSIEGDEIVVGGISSVGTDSESGYVVVAGESSLGLTGPGTWDLALMPIDRSEIPEAYALLINAPVLQSFRYVSEPHAARLGVHRYPVQDTLRKVNDHTTISSRISEEGEVVTAVEYFVKNTSDQYLRMTLPEDATLWSAAVDDRSVKALEAGQAGTILIPLHRRLDPNQPSRIRIEYAQSKGELGWRRTLDLHAPAVAAQSVFARWTIQAPEKYAAAGVGGNMMADAAPRATGMVAFAHRIVALGGLTMRQAPAWLAAAVVLLGGLCWITYQKGCGRHLVKVSFLVAIAGAAALMAATVLTDGGRGLGRCATALVNPPGPTTETGFTRMVSMADRELDVRLNVVPVWVGSGGSILFGAIGLSAGLVIGGLAIRTRSPLLLAGAATVGVWGMSQTLLTVQLLVALVMLGGPVWLGVLAIRAVHRAGWRRRFRTPIDLDPPPMMTPAPAGAEGAVSPVLLGVLAAILLGVGALASDRVQAGPTQQAVAVAGTATLRLAAIRVDIQVSSARHGEAPIADVNSVLQLEVLEPGTYRLLQPGFVMTEVALSSDRFLRLVPDEYGTWLHADRKGLYEVTYRYLAEVRVSDGGFDLGLDLPEALKNEAILHLGDGEMDVYSAQAVLLNTTDHEVGSETRLVFAPTRDVSVGWKPRLRRTGQEKARYFAEVNTLFLFDAGVVQARNAVRYQIAQGELQIFRLAIPPTMSVTAVRGVGLSTWRFDPRSHTLEAVLDRPVTGHYDLEVVTQVTEEGLPYTEVLSLPRVEGTERQRGTVSVSVPSSVQVRVADTQGLSSMNISDAPGVSAPVKRAFRYHQLPASLTVEAEPVLAELRVSEHAQLDVSDERSVLSTRLTVAITKSGVFSISLVIPDDFEVESLSGQDVSHWDEVGEHPHRVQVHYDKQIQGEREVQLVLARSGKGIAETIRVPRVSVENARKHTGTLLVSGERGVRLFTAARDGVSEVNPRELGVSTAGYLGFRLLRPDWTIDLETDVLEPVVKADVVQQVEIGDGMLQAHCFIQYEIGNAGLKTLRFRAPKPGTSLTFNGRHIAEARELDAATALWQVDLDAKVENQYRLEVRYQVPLEAGTGGEVDVLPLQTVETQGQSGFVVIQARGRLRITPMSVSPGLKEDNARNIPADFGAGDLSDAILCYRSTRPDYAIVLDMVRHDSAPVLPASVTEVNLTSVVAEDGHMATRVNLRMAMGELRFLEMALPANARMWAVFVDTQPVVPLIRDDAILVPLEEAANPNDVMVEAIYGGVAMTTRFGRRQRVDGPTFNLPLRDVQWHFYLPLSRRYYGFEGTVQRVAGQALPHVLRFDARTYQEQAQQEVAQNVWRAEEEMRLGEQYASQGQQLKARKAFENAMYNSQSASEVNEDARIQFRNLARRQAVVGLVNRRDSLKKKLNLGTQVQEAVPLQWTTADGMKIEAALEEKDNDALNVVAEKILDQQTAAAGAAPAIRVTMPLHGQVLQFHRDLQIHPYADLNVQFSSRPKGASHRLLAGAVLAGIFGFVRVAAGRRLGRRPSIAA